MKVGGSVLAAILCSLADSYIELKYNYFWVFTVVGAVPQICLKCSFLFLSTVESLGHGCVN